MKFGGTSMGSAEMIEKVGRIIVDTKKSKHKQPIVVVSAMTGVTNKLIEAAQLAVKSTRNKPKYTSIIKALERRHLEAAEYLTKNDKAIMIDAEKYIIEELGELLDFLDAIAIIKEISPISNDNILAMGEKLSAHLLAAHLNAIGHGADYQNLAKLLKRNSFNKVDKYFYTGVEKNLKKRLRLTLNKSRTPVLTGFFGHVPGGIIESVGRGYSDFTAALAGAAFGADEIQIWTDVDGMLSADPRLVSNTNTLEEVSFDEAGELAHFGAKVIHPQTIWPAVKEDVPVRIKNTFDPSAVGTLITKNGKNTNHFCKSITAKKGQTLLTILSSRMILASGFLASVFDIFREHKISIEMVSTSEASITMTFESKACLTEPLLKDLRQVGKVQIQEQQAVICVVGSEMVGVSGTATKIIQTVADEKTSIHAIFQSGAEISVGFVVPDEKANDIVVALHKKLLG